MKSNTADFPLKLSEIINLIATMSTILCNAYANALGMSQEFVHPSPVFGVL
jgi:hypothetical protein